MSFNGRSTSIDEREVFEWLNALEDGRERARAATELARLGVWSRGSLLPRGTVWSAATNRLPQPERIAALLNTMKRDADPNVRAQAALAIGEWGGGETVDGLAEMLNDDADAVREQAIGALGKIGGRAATHALVGALQHTNRLDALSILDALEDLLTGGSEDDTDATLDVVQPPQEFASTFETTLEAIRTGVARFVELAASTPDLRAAESKGRGVFDIITNARSVDDEPEFSNEELHALLAEIDRLPPDPIVDRAGSPDLQQAAAAPADEQVAMPPAPKPQETPARSDAKRTKRGRSASFDKSVSNRAPTYAAVWQTGESYSAVYPVSEVSGRFESFETDVELPSAPLPAGGHTTPGEGPIDVRVTLEQGTLAVRIDVIAEAFEEGSARLEFRGPDGTPLTFETITGEPVAMTITLNLQEDDRFYGEWMAAVNVPDASIEIPDGATLHVEAFPRGEPHR